VGFISAGGAVPVGDQGSPYSGLGDQVPLGCVGRGVTGTPFGLLPRRGLRGPDLAGAQTYFSFSTRLSMFGYS
jgi:hypothetical protein